MSSCYPLLSNKALEITQEEKFLNIFYIVLFFLIEWISSKILHLLNVNIVNINDNLGLGHVYMSSILRFSEISRDDPLYTYCCWTPMHIISVCICFSCLFYFHVISQGRHVLASSKHSSWISASKLMYIYKKDCQARQNCKYSGLCSWDWDYERHASWKSYQ